MNKVLLLCGGVLCGIVATWASMHHLDDWKTVCLPEFQEGVDPQEIWSHVGDCTPHEQLENYLYNLGNKTLKGKMLSVIMSENHNVFVPLLRQRLDIPSKFLYPYELESILFAFRIMQSRDKYCFTDSSSLVELAKQKIATTKIKSEKYAAEAEFERILNEAPVSPICTE